MKNSILILILFWMAGAGWLKAENPNALFAKANSYYSSGAFDSAAVYYDSILHLGYESAELYFNAGNARYRLGDIAAAIYDYEKALKLNPRFEDARFNLQLARLRTVDKMEAPKRSVISVWWRDLLRSRSADQWAVISTVMIWIAFFMALLYLFAGRRNLRVIAFFSSLFFLFLTLFVLFLNIENYRINQNSREAIVFAPNAYVKSEPGHSATDLFIIHEGTKVKVLDAAGQWYRIQLSDDKQGWIPAEAVRVI